MQTTNTYPFCKAVAYSIFTALLLMVFVPFQSQAQQNPYPFSLDVNFGGGLIGDPSVDAAFQPELGFSYIPDKFGMGLNAGFLSYAPSFNAESYASGFEEYTAVTKSGEKWTSFYVGIGPRFAFGGRLPLAFRGSLDLAMTYNSPPETSVDFYDPTGSTGDAQLRLTGYGPENGYSKWSAALRPEFQIQFSPGGSERFSINLTTGIQHRLTENAFTYSQKDLSEVRSVPSAGEMLFQFENAPDMQRRATPPQTNFFSSVGIKIKFGKSRSGHLHKEGIVHRDIASRNVTRVQDGGGDCDDGNPCLPPGERAAEAQDYNSSRSNKVPSRAAEGGGDCDDGRPCPHPGDKVAPGQDYNSSRSNRPRTRASAGDATGPIRWMASESIIVSGSVTAGSDGTNPLYEDENREGYNPLYESGMNNGDGNESGENSIGAMKVYSLAPVSSCTYLPAQNHNSSRSNRTRGIASFGSGGDLDGDGFPDVLNEASLSISKRSARTQKSGDDDNTEALLINLEFGDPDSDDDGLMDLAEASTFSISRKATGKRNGSPLYSEDGNSGTNPMYESEGAANDDGGAGATQMWTYDLSSLSDGGGDLDADADGLGDLLDGAELSIIHQNGMWHYNLRMNDDLDSDVDGDGYGEALKNSSFSISKRSARTGR